MPMVVALALLNLMHPGLVLRGEDGEFPRLSRQEKKAKKMEKKADKARRKEMRKLGRGKDVDEEAGQRKPDAEWLAMEADGDGGVGEARGAFG